MDKPRRVGNTRWWGHPFFLLLFFVVIFGLVVFVVVVVLVLVFVFRGRVGGGA
jgi:hypothetical protein